MNEKFPLFLIEKRPGGSTHSSLEPAFPCGLLMVLREMSDTLTTSIPNIYTQQPVFRAALQAVNGCTAHH